MEENKTLKACFGKSSPREATKVGEDCLSCDIWKACMEKYHKDVPPQGMSKIVWHEWLRKQRRKSGNA